MKKSGVLLVALLSVFNVNAAEDSKVSIDTKNIYVGGGLGLNSMSGFDSGMGFQFFAGYELPVKMGKGTLSAEVGYMDTGSMEASVSIPSLFGTTVYTVDASASGLWGNAVYELPLQDKLSLLGRAGLDLGDDDGFMFGAGIGYHLNEKMDLRGEYVIRDNINSMQLNFVMKL